MSGAGLIEMLAARLGGRGMRRSAPALREVLASAMPNRAPVTAYEPIASRLDDPMAEGAMLSGTNDVSTPMPNAIRTGPDAGPVQGGRLPEDSRPGLERALREAGVEAPLPATLPRTRVNLSDVETVFPRRAGIEPERLAQQRANPSRDPVLVRRDEQGRWRIIDGNHRVTIARERGLSDIEALDASDLFMRRAGPRGRSSFVNGDGDSVYQFAGPRDTQFRVWITQEGKVDFQRMGVAGDPWMPVGDMGAGEARGVFREVVASIRDNATSSGLNRYTFKAYTPEQARLYYQIAQRELRNTPGWSAEIAPDGALSISRTAPDGGSARNGNVYYRGVRSGDALDGEGPIYLHRDPGKASEFAGARFDSDGRPLVEITGEGGNVARVTADFSNPKEVSNQEMAALGYEPYRIQQFTAQGFDAAISPNGEVLVFNRAAVNPSRTAPNAGSDRNALQRALRDRMNRE